MNQNEKPKVAINPTFNLGNLIPGNKKQGAQREVFTFLENDYKLVDFVNKKGEPKKENVITARRKEDGIDYSLWLTPKTLKTEVDEIKEKKGSLKGLKVCIYSEEYDGKFGTSKAYRCRIVNE